MCGKASHLSEQPLEQRSRQHVPGYRVGDGGEDPVQLAQRGLAIRLLARDAIDEFLGDALVAEQAPRAKPAQGHLQVEGAGQAGVLGQHESDT